MKLKNILALSVIILLIRGTICCVFAEDIRITNVWGVTVDVALVADTGSVNAQIQSFTYEILRPTGYKDQYVAHLVFVPDRRLIWVGYAKEKYVCVSNAILGISAGLDTLVINKQTTQLLGSMEEQTEQVKQIAIDFEKKMKAEKFDDLLIIDLGETLMGLRGESPFLPPEQRVRPARPASIADLRAENGILSLPLIGENNIKVALDFDNSMNVIKGTITDNTGRQPWPMVLKAQVRLKPDALEVSPGILTAFVRLTWGYSVANITSATCDRAKPERMMLSDDGTEMIMKFRRQDIEAALAQIGEHIDTNFVLQGTWQDSTATNFFQGTASIKKIVGVEEKKK